MEPNTLYLMEYSILKNNNYLVHEYHDLGFQNDYFHLDLYSDSLLSFYPFMEIIPTSMITYFTHSPYFTFSIIIIIYIY
jgi:hypothetical protein